MGMRMGDERGLLGYLALSLQCMPARRSWILPLMEVIKLIKTSWHVLCTLSYYFLFTAVCSDAGGEIYHIFPPQQLILLKGKISRVAV